MASKNSKLKAIWATVVVIATIVGLITAYPTLRAMYDEHVLDKPPLVPGTNAILMSLEDYEQRQLKLRHDIEAELQEAHQEDRARLQAELDAVNARLADLPEAYDEALKRIKALEAQMAALEGQVSKADLSEARAALGQGNLRKAETLFEQVRDGQDKSIKLAAGAEYGLGQIAEEEIRWHDAHTHYANAARLDPDFDNLLKAREYAWLAGDFAAAHRHGQQLLAFARKRGSREKIARALNEHALSIHDLGRYAEAEELYREALEIGRATIGEGHPRYAIHLNNLAGAVVAQRRYAEAERLYREALEITREAVGEGHPSYATHLNNLAGVMEAQGRYAEAERLYREALETGGATIGEGHPDYASQLSNLALAVLAQGRNAEAERLLRKAIEIDRATIGEGHPSYAIHLNNLAGILVEKGQPEAARTLFEQALGVFRETLPPEHPDIALVEGHIADLP